MRSSCKQFLIGLVSLSGLLLCGCVDHGLAPGFYVRSDMLSTDCVGNANPADVNARANQNPWAFVQAEEENVPGTVSVPDCKSSGPHVDRAVGLAVSFGDVIVLGTSIVGPSGLPSSATVPATIAEPVRIPVRFVSPVGRLYPVEDQVLAAIFSMARGKGEVDGDSLASAVDRRGPILWGTLIRNMRFRRLAPDVAASRRNGLYAAVDRTNWCDESFRAIRGMGDANARRDAQLIRDFLGEGGACSSSGLIEVSGIGLPARGALHAVAKRSASNQGEYPSGVENPFALYTLSAIEVQGARMRAEGGLASTWTLRDWEEAKICRDAGGNDLKIKSINLRSRTFLEIVDDAGPASHKIDLIFAQTDRQRRMVPPDGVSGTLRHSDLDKLYLSDLHSIQWTGWPAAPHMCLLRTS